jgi:hypothetical protein
MSVFDIPKGCQNAATVHPYSPVSIWLFKSEMASSS